MGILLPTQRNPLLACDVYKMGHLIQYAPGTSYVHSVLSGRSDKKYQRMLVYGTSYYLQQYLATKLEPWMADEYLAHRSIVHGFRPNQPEVEQRICDLCKLGHWPLRIRAVPEGTVLPAKSAVLTVENTVPGFHWCVGHVESLLLKLHETITSATCSMGYREIVDREFDLSVDGDAYWLKDYMIHDFGYRSAKSEEDAVSTGFGHLITSKGSDMVPTLAFGFQFYDIAESFATKEVVLRSIAATEHSVMCSYGRDGEIEAIKNILKLYPDEPVSIVSDTYNIWRVLTEYLEVLEDDIRSRPEGATVVFRPDSGNPPDVVCGTRPDSTAGGAPEERGCLRLLADRFEPTKNNKGFFVLNPLVGLIYGDAMYDQRYSDTLVRMRGIGLSAQNLPVGVGGILRSDTRDTIGFNIKATEIVRNGETIPIWKDPITDPGKKSYRGRVGVFFENGDYVTRDELTPEEAQNSLLQEVFCDGEVLVKPSLGQMRRTFGARQNHPVLRLK